MKPFNPKPIPCKVCGETFTARTSLHRVCSVRCSVKLKKIELAEERAKVKTRREKAKPRAKWLAECQAIVNRYARIRDAHLPCVSCDRPASWDGQWHGSHFRSVGAASAVRFNLWNVHKACSICNNHLSGNIAEYRPRLIAKIGQERVDWLMAQNNLVYHDVDYLKKFKKVMGKRLRRLEARIGR